MDDIRVKVSFSLYWIEKLDLFDSAEESITFFYLYSMVLFPHQDIFAALSL